MALRVKEDNFEEEVLKAKLPVIAEFYSDSCVPCKQLSVILGDLEEEYEDKVKIVKVNVNFSAELTEKYHVMASPTTLFFKNEKEVERIVGIAKKDALKDIVEKLI